MKLAVAVPALAASACVDPLTTKPVSTPQWTASNVEAYAETAMGLPPDQVLAHDLVIVGDAARWRECTAVDACSRIERTRPAKDLVAVEHVAKTSVDGEEVEILKLSLVARPTYVVPTWKATQR